ncbi:hypothetical protein J6590_001850 [Homalodisca vitripennis]|nr:hypothetical protein J6590_001850 [Homalodisca vitripennis]
MFWNSTSRAKDGNSFTENDKLSMRSFINEGSFRRIESRSPKVQGQKQSHAEPKELSAQRSLRTRENRPVISGSLRDSCVDSSITRGTAQLAAGRSAGPQHSSHPS